MPTYPRRVVGINYYHFFRRLLAHYALAKHGIATLLMIGNGVINMSTRQHASAINGVRDHEFRIVNGRMITVGLPLPIELAALKAAHSIKPYTSPERRTYLQSVINAGKSSLKSE